MSHKLRCIFHQPISFADKRSKWDDMYSNESLIRSQLSSNVDRSFLFYRSVFISNSFFTQKRFEMCDSVKDMSSRVHYRRLTIRYLLDPNGLLIHLEKSGQVKDVFEFNPTEINDTLISIFNMYSILTFRMICYSNRKTNKKLLDISKFQHPLNILV